MRRLTGYIAAIIIVAAIAFSVTSCSGSTSFNDDKILLGHVQNAMQTTIRGSLFEIFIAGPSYEDGLITYDLTIENKYSDYLVIEITEAEVNGVTCPVTGRLAAGKKDDAAGNKAVINASELGIGSIIDIDDVELKVCLIRTNKVDGEGKPSKIKDEYMVTVPAMYENWKGFFT